MAPDHGPPYPRLPELTGGGLAPSLALALAFALPDRIGIYGGLISGLVTLGGVVAGGAVALVSDDAHKIARAVALGAGAGGVVGLIASAADAA